MNIFIVTESFWPTPGGSKTVIREISKRLVRRGNKVSILAGRESEEWPQEETLEGVRIRRYSVSRATGINYYFSSIKNSRKAFLKIVDGNEKVDIVHFHTPLPASGILIVAKKLRIPIVHTFYGPWCEEFRVEAKARANRFRFKFIYHLYAASLYHPMKRIDQLVLQNSKYIIVLSQYSQHSIRDIYGSSYNSKVIVIPGGVDTKRFKLSDDRENIRRDLRLPNDKFILLTVRRLVPRMGLAELIHAMETVVKQKANVLLVIGGKGILRNQLEELTVSLGLREHIIFTDYIPEENLFLYYQAADVFVLPSQSLEGFGLITLEAFASGLPVLATPVGANPELVGKVDQRLLLPGVDPSYIAEGILKFMAASWKDGLGKRCREVAVKSYSWDKAVDRYEKLYYSLVG